MIKQKLKKRNALKKLRERHVLQIMREGITGDRYRLNEEERLAYVEIFNTCPYAANVYLMVMELGKSIELDMPEEEADYTCHLEYLMDIRFFNPFDFQL